MDALRCWIWLAGLSGVGSASAARLLERFGTPQDVYFAGERDYQGIEGLTPREIHALSDKGLARADAALERCTRCGIGILTLADGRYPERLKYIYAPPTVLFYKGKLSHFDGEPSIAVVGSRKASADGLLSARRLGMELAQCGMTVVSGLAAGIDAMALEGALKAGGHTAGVLGCGADVVYPKQNAGLYEAVAENGVLISEFLPGTPPLGANFPRRNRILSGLCLGVLVVEAAEKSGALITADYAAEQGRDLYAVPGSINSPLSRGSNRLLREGAVLAESGWDIASNYVAMFPKRLVAPDKAFRPVLVAAPPPVIEKPQNSTFAENYNETQRAILTILAQGGKNRDELIIASGLEASDVLSQLTMLEIEGAIVQQPGGLFSLTPN